MGSADDAKRDESERPDPEAQDQAGSAFGPPVSEFGPPVTGFGPPVKDFPQVPSGGAVGWTPADTPERPTLGWQPADTPVAPPAPAPPPYRAPESPVPPRVPEPPVQRAPASEPADERGRDSETWWKSTSDGYPPVPPKQSQAPARPSSGSVSSGSLWDDDELAKKLVAQRPAPAELETAERAERGRGPIIVGVAAALAAIIAIVLVIVFVNRGNEPDGGVVAGPSSNTVTSAMNCPASSQNNITTGNGAGDTDTGAGAILGFQHAFYADRNGAKVRTFVAPDTDRVPSADEIQQAIDQKIPSGTRFCLRIEQLAADRFTTELTEFRPDGGKTVYRQLVTTVNQGGKNLVWGIVSI